MMLLKRIGENYNTSLLTLPGPSFDLSYRRSHLPPVVKVPRFRELPMNQKRFEVELFFRDMRFHDHPRNFGSGRQLHLIHLLL